MKEKIRHYAGNPKGEKLADFWCVCEDCGNPEQWTLYSLGRKEEFVNFKLCAWALRVCRKGNYWLSVRPSPAKGERRIVEPTTSRDAHTLRIYRPTLYSELIAWIDAYYARTPNRA